MVWGRLMQKKLLHRPVEQGVWKRPSESVSRAGSTQLSSALLSPLVLFLITFACAGRLPRLRASKPATEGRKWAFLQWLSSSLVQKLICPRNLQDLLLLSLAQMSAWLLMTQEASELFFDGGSPSQTRVHKKRTTGMSLSCWPGTLACRYTAAPSVVGEDWTEAQQLLMSRASHLSL